MDEATAASAEGTTAEESAVSHAGLLPVPQGPPVAAPVFRPFDITIDHRARVCYALAHNRVPTVRSITVRNQLGGVSGQLTISVSITWTAADLQPMQPTEVVVDLPLIGAAVTISGETFRLDDAALVDLVAPTPAKLIVTVRDTSGVVQTEERDLTVLARNQWLNDHDLYAMTAAFVQPNHPSVNEILRDASGILMKETGSASLEGYQSGPERAALIGRAVFLALQQRVDRYINPPASYEEEGQQLRPLDEVLEQRQGTCIDLACAYASCLEQTGLSPLIFMVHGHAFSGFYTVERGADRQAVEANFSTIITTIDSGFVVAAETTILADNSPFEDASAMIRKHMAERSAGCEHCGPLTDPASSELNHLVAMIDVVACHRSGILPLPARVVRDGIVTIVIDNGPTQPAIVERRDERTRKLLPNTVPARVQQWKNSLLDLSFRNTLLNYRPERTGIQLLPPSKALNDIEDWLAAGQALRINPVDGLSPVLRERGIRDAQQLMDDELNEMWKQTRSLFGTADAGAFETKLRNLNSKAKVDEQDSGVNNLYLTLGALKWSDTRSSVGEVRSPIFMVPIRLAMKRGQSIPTIVMDDGAMTSINYCLVEALRARRGLRLEWFSDDMGDDFGLDVDRGLQELRQEILDQRLTDHGFEVVPEASIGLLKFSKIRLWKDLNDHWELFTRNSIVEHLIEGRRGKHFVDPRDPDDMGVESFGDADLVNPQPADGAQSKAIVRALHQHSFVLEGPPGTGKSQTITNLLANALAKGKKVLFVAEKQAALEVVKERLAEVGLDPFCLDMHDKGSSAEDIKKQLRDALDFVPVADLSKWHEHEEKFDRAARVLDVYRDKIHGPNSAGLSYYQAYSRLLEIGEEPTGSVTRHLYDVTAGRVGAWRSVLSDIESYTLPARPRPGHPWALAEADFTVIDRKALGDDIVAVSTALDAVQAGVDPWSAVLRDAETIDDVAGVLAVMRTAHTGSCPPSDQWRDAVAAGWADSVLASIDSIEQQLRSVAEITSSVGVEVLSTDLGGVSIAVKAAAESFVLGRKGRVKTALGALGTTAPMSTASPDEAVALIGRLCAASQAIRSSHETLRATRGLVMPAHWSPLAAGALDELRGNVDLVRSAGQFLASGTDVANRALAASGGLALPTDEQLAHAAKLVDAFRSICTAVGATGQTIELWCSKRSELAALNESLVEWRADTNAGTFRSLSRWLSFAEQVARLDDETLAAFRTELLSGVITGEQALAAFDRALMAVTIAVVGELHDLDVFDHVAHNRRVNEFIALLRERQELLKSVIPHMLNGARTFNAGVRSGAVGDLRVELNSRRRGARSVRGLIGKYPDLIASLAPCFLMSPDSIAKFIEPGRLTFDLVVFDEASQITVASAIGALGRSDAAVIVGDSRQMPPTAVGVASGAQTDDGFESAPDAEETAVITDAESILDECLESGLDQEWLAWHYRSKDELLIKFSNDKYYDGRLSSFPSPWPQVPGCGIAYHRIEGQFDHGGRRTNDIEGAAIVAEVQRRANDPALSRHSIGVVTLNLEQRELIIKKLTELNDPAVTALLDSDDDSENLFVLNLESVQGRERDVIILGTSFSGRVGGGKMPLNFGPLTLKGGERRLNVAITRARRQVVVVSSFDPEELSSANSLGMTHLYEYLKLARAASEGQRPESNVPSPVSDDLHRTLVADALRERGLIVQTGVGLSSFKIDLAVTLPGHEGRWLVGVLLDGTVWASRPLVLDRDALPTTVLQNLMGWRQVVRVWLPSWRADSAEIVKDIYDAAVLAAAAPEEGPPEQRKKVAAPNDEDAGGEAESDDAAVVVRSVPTVVAGTNPALTLAGERPFESPQPLPPSGTVTELDAMSPRARAALTTYVEQNGPMSLKSAVKATANAFELKRVRDARLAELYRLADPSIVVDTDFGQFVFPAQYVDHGAVTTSFDWFRRSDGVARDLADVAPHEIANLCRSLAKATYSMGRDEMINEALLILGYKRKFPDKIDHISRVVDWAVAEGYLSESDGRIGPAQGT